MAEAARGRGEPGVVSVAIRESRVSQVVRRAEMSAPSKGAARSIMVESMRLMAAVYFLRPAGVSCART